MATWTKREITQLKDDPNDYPYDDLQVSLSTAKVPSSSAPTWRTYDFGLGGPSFSVLGFDTGDYVDLYVQTSHSMLLNSILDSHIHYTLPSDSADDRIRFQLDVVGAGIGDDFVVPDGSPYDNEIILQGNESNRHNLMEVADIPPINTTVSSVYICRLSRIAASADDYAPEVYVLFNDCHYQKISDGSYFEAGQLSDEMVSKKGKPSKPFRSGAW